MAAAGEAPAGAARTAAGATAPSAALGAIALHAAAGATPAKTAPGATPPKAAPGATPPAPVEDLATRLDLRGPFNLGKGKVRILAFLSPTCSHCAANASKLQAVLRSLPAEEIDVHVVWLQVLESDDRAAAVRATKLLYDRRVHHYWDPKRVLNHQLLDAVEFDVQVRLYDVFLLYDRKAAWEQRLPRPGFWMHEYKGAPGPVFDPAVFATQIGKALRGELLGSTN